MLLWWHMCATLNATQANMCCASSLGTFPTFSALFPLMTDALGNFSRPLREVLARSREPKITSWAKDRDHNVVNNMGIAICDLGSIPTTSHLYTPLKSLSFRLLRLLPASNELDQVCCTMEEFDRESPQCPSYGALSYVWEDANIT